MASDAKHAGPVVIAYDGTPAAVHAMREARAVLAPRRALVVTVWKEGLGFELLDNPTVSIGMPPAPIDVRTAVEVDELNAERAQRTASHGADLAREAGFDADGLAVADDVDAPVAETIVDVARGRDAPVIVIGAHRHGRLSEVVLGSTSRDVVRRAECPVLVVRER